MSSGYSTASQLSDAGLFRLRVLLQCGELEAALRHQQQAYTELEGQLSGSRQKGKELQARTCTACPLLPPVLHTSVKKAGASGSCFALLAQDFPHTNPCAPQEQLTQLRVHLA